MATRSRSRSAAKTSAKTSGASESRSRSGEVRNDAAKHNPEQGSRAIDGEVEEDPLDNTPDGVDIGSAAQLPGAEDGRPLKRSGVPEPTEDNAPLDVNDPKAVQKYREGVHERAEEARNQGTGGEPARFNKGATG